MTPRGFNTSHTLTPTLVYYHTRLPMTLTCLFFISVAGPLLYTDLYHCLRDHTHLCLC